MTFKIPEPFISHTGEPCIPLETKTLFGRMLHHLTRQWPDHEVIGYPYSVSVIQWNTAITGDVRKQMLDRLKEQLFYLAAQDGLSIIGLSPVMLLPVDNIIPDQNAQLARLLKVTPAVELPPGATMEQNFRMLYQRAHVITPMIN